VRVETHEVEESAEDNGEGRGDDGARMVARHPDDVGLMDLCVWVDFVSSRTNLLAERTADFAQRVAPLSKTSSAVLPACLAGTSL
jgi:hypothetical protein